MIKATADDKTLIIDLLTRSFHNNPSVNYIVRQDNRKIARIQALMAYSFDICLRFGEVWLTQDRNACALLLFPDRKKTTIWLDIKLIVKAIGISGIAKTLKREAQVKKKHPKTPMAYLWFIGVNPSHQHKGIGSLLLEELIQKQDRPIFLETSVPQNLPWYERFKFHVYDRLELNYTLYFLSYNYA